MFWLKNNKISCCQQVRRREAIFFKEFTMLRISRLRKYKRGQIRKLTIHTTSIHTEATVPPSECCGGLLHWPLLFSSEPRSGDFALGCPFTFIHFNLHFRFISFESSWVYPNPNTLTNERKFGKFHRQTCIRTPWRREWHSWLGSAWVILCGIAGAWARAMVHRV